MKVRPEVGAQRLVGNATMDLFAIDHGEKSHNPAGGIIRFTGGKCDVHATTFFPRMIGSTVYRQAGAVSRIAQGQESFLTGY